MRSSRPTSSHFYPLASGRNSRPLGEQQESITRPCNLLSIVVSSSALRSGVSVTLTPLLDSHSQWHCDANLDSEKTTSRIQFTLFINFLSSFSCFHAYKIIPKEFSRGFVTFSRTALNSTKFNYLKLIKPFCNILHYSNNWGAYRGVPLRFSIYPANQLRYYLRLYSTR